MDTNRFRARRDEAAWEARRLRAVEALRGGESLSKIAADMGVSRQAVWKWRQAYRRQGTRGLNRRRRPGRPTKLSVTQRGQIPQLLARGAEAYGFGTPVWTTQRVASVLRDRFGVRYHADHVGRLLHACGLSWQKAAGRALERDETAIARWKSRTWPSLKKKLKPAGR